MMKETIDLINGDYGTIRRDPRLSSNQIRTRQSSFKSIANYWRKFRLSVANKALDVAKKELVNVPYKGDSLSLSSGSKAIIRAKTAAIARLEEKIKILSKESVPTNFVRNRAIKLRSKMMENLVYNGMGAYFVKADEGMNNIFEPNVPVVEPAFEAAAMRHPTDIDLEKVLKENSETLASEVNKAMKDESTVKEVIPTINRSEISDAIDNEYSKVEDAENPVHLVSAADVASVVNDAFDKVNDIPENVAVEDEHIPVISKEEIESTINSRLQSVDNENDIVLPTETSLTNDLDIEKNVSNTDASSDIVIPEVPVIPFDEGQEKAEEVNLSDNPSNEGQEKAEEVNLFDNPSNEGVEFVEPDFEKTPEVETEKNDSTFEEDVPAISLDEIKEEIDSAVDRLKVSSNNSVEAKIDRFDREGNVKKPRYDYTPMTNEEIAAARENIQAEAYEELYRNEWKKKREGLAQSVINAKSAFTPKPLRVEKDDTPIREVPIVVPERVSIPTNVKNQENEELEEYSLVESPVEEENSEGLHFDYSDATEKDLVKASSVETSVKGLEALKERAKRLKEENERSRAELADVRKEQSNEAQRALEAKNANRAMKRRYEEAIKKLEDYCDALAEDTKINNSSAAISREDIACNRRFTEDQEAEIVDYDDQISEISSIIGQEAINVRRR